MEPLFLKKKIFLSTLNHKFDIQQNYPLGKRGNKGIFRLRETNEICHYQAYF